MEILLPIWPQWKWPQWPKPMVACGYQPRCLTDTRHTPKHTRSSVWGAIHHEAKTGQKTMGNEAWLILLARGHKQSVENQRRRKHNPSGPTSCCMSCTLLWWGKMLHSCTLCTHSHTEWFNCPVFIYHMMIGVTWCLFLTLGHFYPSFYVSSFIYFSFSAVLVLGGWGKAGHKALALRDPYWTKLAFWAFCIYACHADNEAFIRVASISKLERQGWGMKSGKAVTDTEC